ncbi:vasculin-like protein 1 isoform X1 [Rana temporaria]|uniref:vasculin-like protein 1 isoform X1 n=1 Tax=Rana temporaria TaxID=8407 RepID=UPI001AAD4439|nr:vasculin-like protein 1 isoform X1 [Rana temporaria]XP_040190308.1 vasculin-like protein 1 isoform X1 [Rana temporaria]
MAQHDFVPAWLSFSTPQSSKSPAGIVEKHGEHLPRGEGRLGVSRRRHNSSDGFFNNGPLRTTGGDSWHQPSLLRHDSVDSGVSKGTNQSGWHGGSRERSDSASQRGANGCGGTSASSHRHRNGNNLSRKNASMQDKQSAETREEKNADKKKPQFEEEDFPSLNPEPGKQITPNKQTGTPTGVWENPPSSKQPLKMLVIKKISKEDPSAFSAAFASTVPHLSNGNCKSNPSGPIYKNLVSKPASASSKPGPWKSNGWESKSGSLFFSRDSAFTSPVLAPGPVLTSPKEGTASVTPPLELSISRLTRMTRRVPDKKSEFLKALKDEQDADQTEDREREKLEDVQNRSPADLNNGDGEHVEESRHLNGISDSLEEQRGRLSYSLEAEHRLLKEMGWQESPENDDDCLPLTEEELQEFQIKSQQLKRHGLGLNGFLRQPRRCALFAWRSPLTPDPGSETDSSSSDTSDDES